MSTSRFVVLALAHPRSAWSSELSRRATSAALPIDYVRCVSGDEVRARLAGGRPYSALIVDAGLPRVDRDLLDTARTSGCVVVVVEGGARTRDWEGIGAGAVLAEDFDPDELMTALRSLARPIDRVDIAALPDPSVPRRPDGWRGRLVAVTGAPGAGRSTVAMAVAQGRGDDPREQGLVLLADLALRSTQAMMHDSPDVIPGVQELVEAHRHGSPAPDELRRLVHAVDDRGYHLLLGLRRHRDWTALRPRALDAALDNLLSNYRLVVADVDPDVEGEPETGSVDVEERNLLARTAIARSDLVIVVGLGGCAGLHTLVRLIAELIDFGVAAERVFPVINRAPRSPRQRASLSRALADLLGPSTRVAPPLFLPDRRSLDELIRDGARLPDALVAPATRGVTAWLASTAPSRAPRVEVPVPVAAGSLGHWRIAEGTA